MTLFVTIHRHAPERCPARDPAMGPALLSHLSPATTGQYGVVVHAEAVADGKHTLYLIAEAGDEEQLRRYLAPFAQPAPSRYCPPPHARRSSTAVAARRYQPDQRQINDWPALSPGRRPLPAWMPR